MIDLDVPRNNSRTTLLHWMAPDVTTTSGTNTTLKIPNPPTGGAPYLQPNPPAGDTAHRYVQLLFAQPDAFAVPASFGNLTANRVGFNLTQFMAATKLGAPLAANYIRVQASNTTTTSSAKTVMATATGTAKGTVTVNVSGAKPSAAGATNTTSTRPAMVTTNSAPGRYGDTALALLAPLLLAAWI
jgi:phosphatidylethanolamine-binding protein